MRATVFCESIMPNASSATLQVNQLIRAASPDTDLTITIDATKPLKPGAYTFQLVVTDDSGNASRPDSVRVVVLDDKAPTAVIDAPTSVGFMNAFTLSARRSFDIGGRIVDYRWTLVSAP